MVRTRIAPSPTGQPHIGTIYQAMFDYVFAKKYKGAFVVRIEDTDRTRFVEGAEEVVLDALDWFGLHPDEGPRNPKDAGPYRQSERLEKYKEHKDILVNRFLPMLSEKQREADNQGHYCAYYCFCTKERLTQLREEQQSRKQVPRYDKYCLNISRSEAAERSKHESHVIRLNIPKDYAIKFDDWLVGDVEVTSNDVDDQVLIKADGFPTYHFAVVVDDQLMHITHIFRGREWLPSTPKHIILYYYFGWERPIYVHLPLILNMDGKGKLSKRHGHASVNFYKEEGYLPDAILNYLANIVWNHPEGKEIFGIKEFEEKLHINQIGGAVTVYANTNEKVKEIISKGGHEQFLTSQGPRFDLDKLKWVNQQYIQNEKSDEELEKIILDFSSRAKELPEKTLHSLIPLVKSRMNTLKEFDSLTEVFFNPPLPSSITDKEKTVAKKLHEALEELTQWEHESIFMAIKLLLVEYKVKMSFFYLLLTGKERGLPLPETMEILGKEKVITRLKQIEV